ncbi:hypothetical protein DVH24_000826 [Malus domestica]|uniref:Uncharacterized protein n=1 Tax=Malus domestica TaxID=3750 RepID=A0A498K5I8_MALDO|nr:hypothetical protein DVH24_000826 [Malus domestica]
MAESVELPTSLGIVPFRNKVLLPSAIIQIRCTSPKRCCYHIVDHHTSFVRSGMFTIHAFKDKKCNALSDMLPRQQQWTLCYLKVIFAYFSIYYG